MEIFLWSMLAAGMLFLGVGLVMAENRINTLERRVQDLEDSFPDRTNVLPLKWECHTALKGTDNA